MRWTLPLLLCACQARLPSEPEPESGPCADNAQLLQAGDRTPWGTTPSTVRASLDPAEATWTDGSSVGLRVEPTWPAGVARLHFAVANAEPDPLPPLWCQDRLELSAGLRLIADGRLDVDGAPVEVLGALRAVGPLERLQLGFVGAVAGEDLPALVPDGQDPAEHDLLVWAWWTRGAELTSRGQVRLAPSGGDELDAGEIVASWE